MARILRQTTVIRDGMHNAFTDLQYWHGAYWVSYRKGAGHVSADSRVCLSVSADRQRFREVATLHVPGDNRDPKLQPMGADRMAMLFASWTEAYAATHQFDKSRLQQFVTFSPDGFNWEKPVPILAPNRWLWRVRAHQGRYWGTSYGLVAGTSWADRHVTLELLVSDDMLNWELVSQVGPGQPKLGESHCCFRDDGEVWIVSRSETPPGSSWFAAAKAPYTEWELTDLKTMIHAPVILEHQGAVYVAGRRSADTEGDTTFPFLGRSSLGLWRLERGKVEPVLRIPATGDCSYAGLIVDPEGRVCMSYYSQHAYHMGVVPQEYVFDTKPPYKTGMPLAAADVYFAELELP